MKRTLITVALLPAALLSLGQGRLVFNNDPYLVFNPAANTGTYLVIDNPNPNAITGQAQGNIISEREENKVRWANGPNTGIYTIPFTTRAPGLTKMGLTVQKNTVGAGPAQASMVFSTYNYQTFGLNAATGWFNTAFMPTDVTHMDDFFLAGVDNSENVIDRFWIIDAEEPGYAYTTKPTVTITFRYDPTDILASNAANGGAITPASALQAQRFHPGPNLWGDMPPIGLSGVNQVSAVSPAPVDFYRSWTLVELNNPLPIELAVFDAYCDERVVVVKWTTASEQNNDFFTVEKSHDGVEFLPIGTVEGAGDSPFANEYLFVDDDATRLAYYRLRQTDFDGKTTVGPVVSAGCDAVDGTEIVNAWDDGTNVFVTINSSEALVHDLTLLDANGRVLLVRPRQVINKGITQLTFPKNGIAMGVYIIRMHDQKNLMTRRVMLR